MEVQWTQNSGQSNHFLLLGGLSGLSPDFAWTSSRIQSCPTVSNRLPMDCPLSSSEMAGSDESPLDKQWGCKVLKKSEIQSHSCRNESIPLESTGIQAHSSGFQFHSSGIEAFLQESVGHQEIQPSPPASPPKAPKHTTHLRSEWMQGYKDKTSQPLRKRGRVQGDVALLHKFFIMFW